MTSIRVNVACGDTYVEGWLNLDYAPHSASVTRADLLGRLPLESEVAEVVYSSHFLEHIPRRRVSAFIAECFRVLRPGGHLRFVLPDLEEMCRTYLDKRARGEHDKADFLVLEMLDQCVRDVPGGELGRFYERISSQLSPNHGMQDYVTQRTGHVFKTAETGHVSPRETFRKKSMHFLNWVEQRYCRALVALLPQAFRRQNVSLAPTGERHAWIYDFHAVAQLLQQAGFTDIVRASAMESGIPDFPLQPLDLTPEGRPRKGAESMYIEACKP